MLSASQHFPGETGRVWSVDLYGLTPAFKQRTFPASAGIKQIRVGDSATAQVRL